MNGSLGGETKYICRRDTSSDIVVHDAYVGNRVEGYETPYNNILIKCSSYSFRIF